MDAHVLRTPPPTASEESRACLRRSLRQGGRLRGVAGPGGGP